jgi:hypothetical protein
MPATPTVVAQADDTPPTLDAFFNTLRAQAADANGTGAGALQIVCEWLAERDGHAFLADLRRAGLGDDQTLLGGLQRDPGDGRHRARLAAGDVAGSPALWLTGAGWKAVGQTRRGEKRPTTQTLTHARAPQELQIWLNTLLRPWHPRMTVTVEQRATEIRDFSDGCSAAAWGMLRVRADSNGQIGLLTGGLRPDALLVERFTVDEGPEVPLGGEAMYRSAHNLPEGSDIDRDAMIETTLALEVESSRKSQARLRDKLARLDAAIDLGRIAGVVWLVRTATVYRQLREFGCGATGRRPGHYLVTTSDIGLGGDLIPPNPKVTNWWPLVVACPYLRPATEAAQ